MNKRSLYYQLALIVLGLIAAVFFAFFLYWELFPEYKIFQNDYLALENFRSTYTNKSPPAFKEGVKQILLEVPDNGPPIIDRCTSCHVALDIPYFSPTKIDYDINGNILLDENGYPIKKENEDYIWKKLDQKISDLRDEKVNAQLKEQNEISAINKRLKEANDLSSLKTVTIDGHVYDVTKALKMHPLMGKETRPFEFHPLSDYGCVSCHGGNGRALTVDKAHGPVFDGEYEVEDSGHERVFLEKDDKNDPQFSKVFNHKPGHKLIFQTTPILVGNLIEAKCMQCHHQSQDELKSATDAKDSLLKQHLKNHLALKKAFDNEKKSLAVLLSLKSKIQKDGVKNTQNFLQNQLDDYQITTADRQKVVNELKFLSSVKDVQDETKSKEILISKIDEDLEKILGSKALVKQLDIQVSNKALNVNDTISSFIKDNSLKNDTNGSIFLKEKIISNANFDEKTSPFLNGSQKATVPFIKSNIDDLTRSYAEGKRLYIEQGCYACHRISGFSRGGIGPELTTIGKNYPWYIKRHIVWPQGDLPTSTMPNFRLDHEELESLMTYLLGQRGLNESVSKVEYKKRINEWESSREMPWEKPISPSQIYDINYAKTVFAVEGCASCHRLKGFESNVGYAVEKNSKDKIDFNTLYKEREWFTKIFPEEMLGSEIVKAVETYAKDIDQHIINDVRKDSLIEEIEKTSPGVVESFYANFKYALRAKDHEFKEKLAIESDVKKQAEIQNEWNSYKERVRRVLMVYVQEYGLGRLIGPRPNWSGIYRSDDWLMEHFKKPGAYTARSIMPVFPFDETKFYALTHMLNVVAKQNQAWTRMLWSERGFNPSIAFQMHCSQCHGEFLGGNGPVSEWIYPIPKNLKNADFLRNYTKERVMNSITHGVDGTPMPPWGMVAKDKPANLEMGPVLTRDEIKQLTDWLFSTLPGSTYIQTREESLKWNYSPEDALKEMREEGSDLKADLSFNDWKQILIKQDLTQQLLVDNGMNSLPKVSETEVSKYFDVVPQSNKALNANQYFIKKKYYTKENLEKGQAFFHMYCATCHGMDADGMGLRAEAMRDAKPRMFTNLDWLDSHDDLYMLRSIKFGVHGTSMTPWGDQTTSLLRMQLVMYIRHLSQDADSQKKFEKALFEAFNPLDKTVDQARVKNVKKMEKNKNAIKDEEVKNSAVIDEENFLENYKYLLDLKKNLNQYKKIDDQYLSLKNILNSERKIYKNLGLLLLSNKDTTPLSTNLNQLLKILETRFTFNDDKLVFIEDKSVDTQILNIKNDMIEHINQQLTLLKKEELRTASSMPSAVKEQKLKEIIGEIKTLTNIKENINYNFQQAKELREKQFEIVKILNSTKQ